MAFPFGALIGLGGSLLGGLSGLFGSDNSSWKHFKNRIFATVLDAKRAGIHPLAALGASGLGGDYGATPITWGDSIGQGMQSFGNAVDDYMAQDADSIDRRRAESAARSADALGRAEARARDTFERNRQARVDRMNEELIRSQVMLNEAQSRSMLAAARASALGARAGGGPEFVPGAFGEGGWHVREGIPNSQDVADKYGDVIGEMYGAGKWIGDVWKENFGGGSGSSSLQPTMGRPVLRGYRKPGHLP